MRKIIEHCTQYLYELIYMLPICILVTGSLCFAMGEEHRVWKYLLAVGTYTYLLLWKHLKKRSRVLLAILSILGLLGGLGGFIGTQGSDYVLTHTFLLIWAFCGLLSYVLYVVMGMFTLKLLVGLGVISWLTCIMIWQLEVPRSCVSASFFLILVILVEWIQRHWEKKGYAQTQMHVVYISAFLLVLVLITQEIPVSNQRCEWKLVKQAYALAREEVIGLWYNLPWSGAVNYKKSSVGFSEVGELVGELDDDSKKVMEIKAGVMPGPTLYLAGKVFDTYNGGGWETRDVSTDNDRALDSLLLMNAAWNYADQQDENIAYDYYKECHLRMRYTGIRTDYFFTPTKTFMDISELKQHGAKAEGANLMFRKTHGYKTNYETTYFFMNQGNEVFRGFLEAEHEPEYSQWDRLVMNYVGVMKAEYSSDRIEEREAYIHELYLPETAVSSEMRAYMDNLLEGAASDAEKLARIEEDLSSFHYNLNPGPLPEDIDSPASFLDYFVLEKREGYCCYYATAFVLMARAEGIPARYVQGFAVPINTTEQIDVYSNMAHAWPEVYFDGLGWVQYEPTPGFANPFSWYTQEEMNAFRQGTMKPEPTTQPVIQGTTGSTTTELPEEKQKFAFHWYLVVLPIGFILFGALCYFLIGKLIEKRNYRNLAIEEQIRVMFWRNARVLKILGLGMEEGETIASYQLRLEEKGQKLSFLSTYEKMLYSRPLTGEELNELLIQEEDCYIALRKLIHGKGKFSLWIFTLFHEM